MELSGMSAFDQQVDCRTCTACCRRECVALVKGDNVADYPEAQEIPKSGLSSILPTFLGFIIPHAEGACIYLKDNKCSIYDKRPTMCRTFSCVGWVEHILATTTRSERRRDKILIDPA